MSTTNISWATVQSAYSTILLLLDSYICVVNYIQKDGADVEHFRMHGDSDFICDQKVIRIWRNECNMPKCYFSHYIATVKAICHDGIRLWRKKSIYGKILFFSGRSNLLLISPSPWAKACFESSMIQLKNLCSIQKICQGHVQTTRAPIGQLSDKLHGMNHIR